MPFVTNLRYYGKNDLLELVSSLPEDKCILLKKLFSRQYDALKNSQPEITKTINEYQSNTRLESACKWMTDTNILTVNEEMHEKTIKTFNHFKNHSDQKQLFSCLNLWKTK